MWRFISEQFQHAFLWTPLLVMAGAVLFFTMPHDAHIYIPGIIAIICVMGAMFSRIPIILRAVLIFIFGFCYAAFFADAIGTPQINHTLRDVEFSGRIINLDPTPDKVRIYISIPASQLNIQSNRHAIVRTTLNDEISIPNVGDTIRATATLYQPGGMDAPDTFDFARYAYFNNLTATGYITQLSIESKYTTTTVNRVRAFLHNRSESFLRDSLILGYKNVVPKSDSTTWTNAGIGHVWSISGFHMTLIGGWMFALFYFILRRIPYITRRVPARISATICAWIALILYLGISGTSVATVRAFIMTTLIFAAIVIGRRAISLRNACIAFWILFLINPHNIMQPGFQLSFAAICGLVWFWGRDNAWMPQNKILRFVYIATMTTIIATLFTLPFVISNFHTVPLYGLLGNLVLLPIFSFVIMPLVLLGTICAIFGCTSPLHFADIIYGHTLSIANAITSMPHATISIPFVNSMAITFATIAICCVILIRHRYMNFIIGAVFICLATGTVMMTPRPTFYATYDHELVGFVNNDNLLEFNKSRASNHYFAFNTWKQINGEPTDTPNVRRRGNHGVYLYNAGEFTIAYIQKFVPLYKNISDLCRRDDIKYIVSYFDIDAPQCNHKILHGGFVIYKSGNVKFTPNRHWHNRH